MESSFLRDQNFEKNRDSMLAVRQRFNVMFIYGFIAGIFLFLMSVYGILFWFSYSSGQMFKQLIMSEQITGYLVTPWLIINPLTVLICVCSMLSCKYYKKLPAVLLYLLFAGHAAGAVFYLTGNIYHQHRPSDYAFGVIWLLYGVVGVFLSNRSFGNFKEIDYLKTQEGFPEFDLNINYFSRSRFVKMREEWLEKKKNYEYYTPAEKPVEQDKIIVKEAAASNEMEGISVGDDVGVSWFAKDLPAEEPTEVPDMIELEVEEGTLDDMPPETEYVKEDIRRKPL